ncbi:MAG: Na+/H+ antiporter subunit B [Planctomycetota bacterium]
MNSIILQTAARALLPLLLVFSVVILIRGHNVPGGGFVGGLLAASAFTVYAMAFGTAKVRRMLRLRFQTIFGLGLLLAFAAGLPGLLTGGSFLQGYHLWYAFDVPGLGEIKLGTPVAFDIGVYFAVMGVCLSMIFELADAEPLPPSMRPNAQPVPAPRRGGPVIELGPGGETIARPARPDDRAPRQEEGAA